MSQLSMHEMQHILVTEPAWLLATDGRLWVTRHSDWDDHILGPGERLLVRRGDDLVVSPWERGVEATWEWRPLPAPAWVQALRRRVLGAGFGAVERALRGAADGLAALARRAAAIACRAQGCMAAGDSMASAGTVQ